MKLKIVYLFFDSRSGSTYLANNISKYLNIVVVPETNFITNLKKFYDNNFIIKDEADKVLLISYLFKERKFFDLGLDNFILLKELKIGMDIKDVIIKILELYYLKQKGENNIIVLKKGNYIFHMEYLKKIDSDSIFLGIIRDGRDVYISKKKNVLSLRNKYFVSSIYESIYEWYRVNKIMLNNKKDIFIIKYEDILEKESLFDILKKIAKYLNVDFNEKSTNRIYYVSEIYDNNLHKNINSKPLKNNKNKWKKELSIYEQCCFTIINKKLFVSFDYDVSCKDRINNLLYIKCISNFYLYKFKFLLKRYVYLLKQKLIYKINIKGQ